MFSSGLRRQNVSDIVYRLRVINWNRNSRDLYTLGKFCSLWHSWKATILTDAINRPPDISSCLQKSLTLKKI